MGKKDKVCRQVVSVEEAGRGGGGGFRNNVLLVCAGERGSDGEASMGCEWGAEPLVPVESVTSPAARNDATTIFRHEFCDKTLFISAACFFFVYIITLILWLSADGPTTCAFKGLQIELTTNLTRRSLRKASRKTVGSGCSH
jgi:hypothetical protein